MIATLREVLLIKRQPQIGGSDMKFFNWLSTDPKLNLNKHRQAIYKIDIQIIELLGYRFHHIKQIAQIQKMHKLPLKDEEGELQIQKNIELMFHLHNLPVEDENKKIFESIIQQSIDYQKKLMVTQKNSPQKNK